MTTVRFSNGSPDVELPLASTLAQLRKGVRQQVPSLQNKRLRFILSGRVVTESTDLSAEHRKQNFDKFYVHCLVGDELSVEELQREDELDRAVQEPSTTPAPVGFDRLAGAGFSHEDIQSLRTQFRQLYGDLPDSNDIRQLEERWIDSSVNQEVDEFQQASGSLMGGNEELLIGVLVGCLLGVFSVLLLREDKLFTRRQKMAVFAGLVVNFSFALVRQWS